jgi:hypothetical protein
MTAVALLCCVAWLLFGLAGACLLVWMARTVA